MIEGHDQICRESEIFCKDLLDEPGVMFPTSKVEVLSCIPELVSERMKPKLMSASTEELREVVFSLKRNKALVPNDFLAEFYHKTWCIIKKVLLQEVEETRNLGRVLKALNSTFVTLVPKIQGSFEL